MKRYGVRPSVRLCIRPSVCPICPLQQRAAGLLLWARRTGDIDQLFVQKWYCTQAKPADTQDLCRLLNDDLARTVGAHPRRFVALGSVPLQAPQLAVDELKRCRHELGKYTHAAADSTSVCGLRNGVYETNDTVSVRLSVCASARLSVPFARRSSVHRVCCCGPGGQEISIDCCSCVMRRANAGSATLSEYVIIIRRRRTRNRFV